MNCKTCNKKIKDTNFSFYQFDLQQYINWIWCKVCFKQYLNRGLNES